MSQKASPSQSTHFRILRVLVKIEGIPKLETSPDQDVDGCSPRSNRLLRQAPLGVASCLGEPCRSEQQEQKESRHETRGLGHSKPAIALSRLTALVTLLLMMHSGDGQSENSCSAKTTCIFTEKSAFAPEKFDPARHRYRGNCPYKPIQKTVLIQVFVPVLWVTTIPFKSILRIHPAQLSRPGNQQALWQPETASGRLQPQTMSDKILGSNNPTLRFQKIRWLDAFCLAGALGHEGAEGS